MMHTHRLSTLLGSQLIALSLLHSAATGQIIPDNTLPTNSTVVPGCTTCTVEGGTAINNQLFHSFEQFSVPNNGQVIFNNGLTIENIFSRVTGASASTINGLIQANGTANFFLINPNGIVFGPNATINVGGSFLATSADRVLFSGNQAFSASQPQAIPTLTMTVPVGLQVGANPGAVINQSTAGPQNNGLRQPVGLSVTPGATLALLGGNVQLNGGNLTAPGGRLVLGSLGPGETVGLGQNALGWTFDFSNVGTFQDIELTDAALVDTSAPGGALPGGAIQLFGRTIRVEDAAVLLSFNSSAADAQPIQINATDTTLLTGGQFNPLQYSSLLTLTTGAGAAGEIQITSPQVILAAGGRVLSLASGRQGGKAGDVTLNATQQVEITGSLTNPNNGGVFPSGIVTTVAANSVGDGGSITLTTPVLLMQSGGQISTAIFGEGNAGNVAVLGAETIEINGSTVPANGDQAQDLPSGIFSLVEREGRGNSGNLTVETEQLRVLAGGQISSAIRNDGQAGTLTVTATESVLLSGFSPLANVETGRSGLFVSAEPAYRNNLGAVVVTTADSGDLILTTPVLTIENGARISADTFGSGSGGDVTLTVDQLQVFDGGQIRVGSLVETGSLFPDQRGNGGTLTITATDRVQIAGSGNLGETVVPSALIAIAEGQGPGGNISVTSPTITLTGGRIVADTQTSNGGNIDLNAQELLLMEDNSLISATAGQAGAGGNGGNITISVLNGFITAVLDEDSDIIANAFEGDGGNINIVAQGIYGLVERPALPGNGTNDIDASSEFGQRGTITINDPTVDPSGASVELPADVINAAELVDRSCQADAGQGQNSLVVTGRGGLPPNPAEIVRSDGEVLADVGAGGEVSAAMGKDRQLIAVVPAQVAVMPALIPAEPPAQIVEAYTWQRNASGQVVLLATDTRTYWLVARTPPAC